MEIRKLYKANGAAEANAVLLFDSGEEYPVFLQSLHNTILFYEMLNSGYVLAGLPYDFVKDGVSIMSLPVEEVTFDDNTMQLMYDSIGTKVDQQELLSHVDTNIARGVPIPPTRYTIHTREEFEKYLALYEKMQPEDDFMPINYFVAPEARFSPTEYISPSNGPKVQIISRRRTMSITKFQKLVKWLEGFGLSPNATFLDVLEAYFAWGIDGMNETIITKSRQPYPYFFNLNSAYASHSNLLTPLTRGTLGLVNTSGMWKAPINERGLNWTTATDNPKDFMDRCSRIPVGQSEVLKLKAPATQELVVFEGTSIKIQFSRDNLVFAREIFPTIQVQAIHSVSEYIDPELALPRNKELMYEESMMRALAKTVYMLRHETFFVSSFDLLRAMGASTYSAIQAILQKNQMLDFDMDFSAATKRLKSIDELGGKMLDADSLGTGADALDRVEYDSAKSWLDGKRDPEGTFGAACDEVIRNIVNGDINTDGLADAIFFSGRNTQESIYEEIFVIHKVLGFSLEDIYNRIVNMDPKNRMIEFTGEGFTYTLNCAPSTAIEMAARRDMARYRTEQAEHAIMFYFVKTVAREVTVRNEDGSIPDYARPIGVEYLYVYPQKKNKELVESILRGIEEELMKAVANTPGISRERYKEFNVLKREFAMQRWFSIFFNKDGHYNLPKSLGGGVLSGNQWRSDIVRLTEDGIDSVVTLSKYAMFNHTTRGDGTPDHFRIYCANAFVGEDFVCPYPEQYVREVPFHAIWLNFDQERRNELISKRVIYATDIPWSIKHAHYSWACYATKQKKDDFTVMDDPDSLYAYFNTANKEITEWPTTLEFKTTTHPVYAKYPGMYYDDESEEIGPEHELEDLITPRVGTPKVELEACRLLKPDTYGKRRYSPQYKEYPTVYIERFLGFDAETLLLCPDAIEKLPPINASVIGIAGDRLYFTDTNTSTHFTNIASVDMNKYPVRHICNRLYIVRDFNNKLWEVHI